MPKAKTHSASKKRFKVTGSGKIKMGHAWRSHRLSSKARKTKKHHRLTAYLSSADEGRINGLLPYAK